jgi:hypothetical protein
MSKLTIDDGEDNQEVTGVTANGQQMISTAYYDEMLSASA